MILDYSQGVKDTIEMYNQLIRNIVNEIVLRRDENSDKAAMYADFDDTLYQIYTGHAGGLDEAISIILEHLKKGPSE